MRGLVLGISLAAVHAAATSVAAAVIPVGDATLEFDPGRGFCALDPQADPFDGILLDWFEAAYAGRNTLLGIFVDCDRLAAIRSGSEEDFGTYGILLAPHDGAGRLTPLPPASRADSLQQLAEAVDAETGMLEEGIATGVERLREALAREGATELAVTETRSLGLLDRDENAVYLGLLANMVLGADPHDVAGVSALTVVEGYMLTYSLYQAYVDEGSFLALLDMARPIMRDLVAANPEAPDGGGWGLRKIGMLLLGLVILLGAGFIVLAPVAIRILRRQAAKRGRAP